MRAIAVVAGALFCYCDSEPISGIHLGGSNPKDITAGCTDSGCSVPTLLLDGKQGDTQVNLSESRYFIVFDKVVGSGFLNSNPTGTKKPTTPPASRPILVKCVLILWR
jgi:hypothetical protein